MRRRDFIRLGGAAAVWPSLTHAQASATPTVGLLNAGSPAANVERLKAFHHGLKEVGFAEGDNVAVLYRWADNQLDRLPGLVADLIGRQVAVIATFGTAPALVVKAATATVPIVFAVSDDPVRLGLATSIARPGGNLTGFNFLATEVAAKRLELLRELVPAAAKLAVLVDPNAPPTEPTLRELVPAASAIGLRTEVFNASSGGEINAAFAAFSRERPDALFVGGGFLFNSRRLQVVHLVSRHGVPASYSSRDFPDVGGLMSYGANQTDAYRQLGVYAGRILKGAKAWDLPIVQSTKLELVINAEAARLLGLTVPPSLLAIADEVIE